MDFKNISSLVSDIEQILVSGVKEISTESLDTFLNDIKENIVKSLTDRDKKTHLRMSNIGKPCERQLWYEINQSELGDSLRAEHYMKFMFGHLIESLVLFLAELAGHEVKGRQDEQEIEGIKGHRDAIIDGTLVDVKSASSFSFKKFKSGLKPEEDAFGYIPQLQSYLYAGQNDEIITDKSKAAFLVVDKTLGHITLDIHPKDEKTVWSEVYNQKKEIVQRDIMPERGFKAEPFGKSGNETISFNCSYCPFKKTCWTGLRTFLYSNRPIDLVTVVREPNVPELKGGDNNEEEIPAG